MSANTNLIVRVNSEDKAQAAAILETVGTNLSSAVNMMLKQIIIQRGLPFSVTTTPKKTGLVEKLYGSVPDPGFSLEESREERLSKYEKTTD